MSVSVRRLNRDMKKDYHISMLGGMEGLDNKVSWIHIIEDCEAAEFLHGNELVLTTGIGNIRDDENLLQFVRVLYEKSASGIMFNLGPYIKTIPRLIIDYCNEVKLPLYTIPWSVRLVDLTRHFCSILIDSEEKERGLTSLVKDYLFKPEEREKLYGEFTRHGFSQHLNYCILNAGAVCGGSEITEEKTLEQLHEVIEREMNRTAANYVVFKNNAHYIVVTGGAKTSLVHELAERIQSRQIGADNQTVIAVSSNKDNLADLPVNFHLSEKLYKLCRNRQKMLMFYDELDTYKILLSVSNTDVMLQYVKKILGNVIEYDNRNGSDYLDFIRLYIEKNTSIQEVASELFVHRNTVHYKITKVREIAGLDLGSIEDIMKIQLCLKIMTLQ